MPTVLYIMGWRLFFYSNEGNEPIHIHAQKGSTECKFWLITDEFDIKEAVSYNLSPAARKEIRKIIFEHYDFIVESWFSYFGKK
jgi:hypothetical protein